MASESEPIVSVVLPVYNDPGGVQKTLESLLGQTYPRDEHEIIVVDNGSEDGTKRAVREFSRQFEHVRLISESTFQSPGMARNAGISHSTGDLLAFIDADMTVEEDWLEKGVNAFGDDVDCFACEIDLIQSDSLKRLSEKYELAVAIEVERFVCRERYIPTGCLFTRRDVIRDVGLFDPRLKAAEDVEFGRRLHESGYELHYVPEITMCHPTRSSFRALLEQHFKKGIGYYQLKKYHPDVTWPGSTQFLKPPNVLYFSYQYDDWADITIYNKVRLFLIEYVLNVSVFLGSVRRLVRDSLR